MSRGLTMAAWVLLLVSTSALAKDRRDACPDGECPQRPRVLESEKRESSKEKPRERIRRIA